MSVRVWFEEDIRNAIDAVALASELLPSPQSGEDVSYLRGFRAALDILRTSFGITIQEPVASSQRGSVITFQAARPPSLKSGSPE